MKLLFVAGAAVLGFVLLKSKAGSGSPPSPTDNNPYHLEVFGSTPITLDPPGGNYKPGTVVKVTSVAWEGWQFQHWTMHGSSEIISTSNPYSFVMPAADVAITAVSESPSPIVPIVRLWGLSLAQYTKTGASYPRYFSIEFRADNDAMGENNTTVTGRKIRFAVRYENAAGQLTNLNYQDFLIDVPVGANIGYAMKTNILVPDTRIVDIYIQDTVTNYLYSTYTGIHQYGY